jgi:DNA-binding NarL/FixJ family response regulator
MLEDGKTADEIAVELKRTRGAIYARMQRLYRKQTRLPGVVDIGLKAKK